VCNPTASLNFHSSHPAAQALRPDADGGILYTVPLQLQPPDPDANPRGRADSKSTHQTFAASVWQQNSRARAESATTAPLQTWDLANAMTEPLLELSSVTSDLLSAQQRSPDINERIPSRYCDHLGPIELC
jgi:hypothetical protein